MSPSKEDHGTGGGHGRQYDQTTRVVADEQACPGRKEHMGHHSHGWANGYSQNWMKVGDLTVIMEMLVVSMTNVWGFKPFQIKWNIEHWRYRFIRVCYLKTGYCKYPQICGLDTNLQLFEIEMWISDLKNWALNQNDGDFRSIVHFCGVSCIQNRIHHIFKTLVCVNVWYIKIPWFRKSSFPMKMAIQNAWINPNEDFTRLW